MGSISSPKTWVPYMNIKDCSQGFCSLYCPQWCYIIFPPPPPSPPFVFSDEDSSPTFSPLVIAIIGILASAFLLVSYYAIISKYCGNMESSSTRSRESHNPDQELEDHDHDHDPSNHEPWLQLQTNGLEESVIKSITAFKYKRRGDGLVQDRDCSVCLSEFQEDECLRLLPKCSHAFHVSCIDTWLKSHSNCPLCRANIVAPLYLPPESESTPASEVLPENDHELVNGEMGNLQERDTIIEIEEEDDHRIRRSVSMDDASGLTAERLVGSPKESHSRNRILHCVMSPIAMKRSFSSGRFLFSKRGRGRSIIIPL